MHTCPQNKENRATASAFCCAFHGKAPVLVDFTGVCLSWPVVQTLRRAGPRGCSWRPARGSQYRREGLHKLNPNSDVRAGWWRVTALLLLQQPPQCSRGDGEGCPPAKSNLLHTEKHLQAAGLIPACEVPPAGNLALHVSGWYVTQCQKSSV